MGHKIGIDELLNATNHLKKKEFMRTDKPSRRKLYIEIYEFKDKETLKKLPCNKEEKTDEAKEGIIEFDVTSKEIIQMKLKPLARVMLSLMRLKQYEIDFKVGYADIMRAIKSSRYLKYGKALSEDLQKDFERWYLVVKRDGSIIGFFNVAWSSQVDGTNKVLNWGGDILTIGVANDEEMTKVMNALNERDEFKKLPMMCICKDYGKLKLDREKWINIDAFHIGYIPRTTLAKFDLTDCVRIYYNTPPINEFGNSEVENRWIVQFKANYERRWIASHAISQGGLTNEALAKLKMEDKTAMEAALHESVILELARKRSLYADMFNTWKRTQERIILNYGNDLAEESVYGAIHGLSKRRSERHHNELMDEENEEPSNDNPCEGCGEYGTNYCRNDCDHSPCNDCAGDNCENCDASEENNRN